MIDDHEVIIEIITLIANEVQKQPFREILKKKFSENMQPIYRRTLLPKCYFNKVAKQLYCKATLLKSHFGKGVLL